VDRVVADRAGRTIAASVRSQPARRFDSVILKMCPDTIDGKMSFASIGGRRLGEVQGF
jgi:hypothetical protein